MERFKVIAPYPHSPYEVGDMVEITPSGTSYLEIVTQEMSQWTNEIQGVEHYSHLDNIKAFPNLFEQLEWWQDLKEDDLQHLPEYIRIDPLIEIEPPFVVFKIIKWELENGELVATTYKKEKLGIGSLKLYLPSNKIEFAKYIREWNQYTKKDEW